MSLNRNLEDREWTPFMLKSVFSEIQRGKRLTKNSLIFIRLKLS